MKNFDIEGQLSLDGFLVASVPLGHVDGAKKGNMIPFQKLKDFIGKKVIYQSETGAEGDRKYGYKLVLIKDYFEDSDQYFQKTENGNVTYMNEYIMSLQSENTKKQYEPAFVCDRIAYSDDDRTSKKANSWLSEAYCLNGRHQITHNSSSVSFFEYKAM
jgi:hypothetical protein